MHVKDIPVVLYEGLLTSIDRHLQLFPFVANNAYNVRAIGTLDIENFFGEFTELDPKGTGVLRPDDVSGALSTACEVLHARLDQSRCFAMKTSSARPYPVHNLQAPDMSGSPDVSVPTALDDWRQIGPTSSITLRDHMFDRSECVKKRHRRKKGDVLKLGAAARGARPVRQHHKTDETKILAHKRLGVDL